MSLHPNLPTNPERSDGPTAAQGFFQISRDLLCVLSRDGRILCANPAWNRFMGEPQAGPNRSTLLELVHPDDQPMLSRLLQDLSHDAPPLIFEGRFSRPDGAYVWLEWNATADPVRRYLYASARDVTERKLVEDELRKLSAFPRLNPQAVFEFSAAGVLTYFNDAASDMARATGHEHPSRILPSETPAVVQLCLQTGDSRLRLETQAGGRTLSWSFYPIGVSGVVHCYAIDITEKRQLEAQFLRAQRLETVGRLATGIAHDLNNILAPIMMSVNLLRENFSEPRCAPLLETLCEACRRGAEMIRQILSFTRGQAGGSSQVDLQLLLQEMARIAGETFPRSITVQTVPAKGLWPVQGDATQVHQILMNLCVNARDAMPNGGTLLLQAENRVLAAGIPELPADAKPGDYVLIRVSDTGSGMSRDVINRIWEPFFTLKPAGQGTGLGLSTVLTIVKAHDGFIRVESEPGRGSCFDVFLPAASLAPNPAAPAQEPLAQAGRGELILVVDDEHAFQEITKAILQKHGYRVLTASDGREGLEVFIRHQGEIDLVMTDMNMPSMGGGAFVNAVRQLKPEVCILTVSGLSEHDRFSNSVPGVPLLLKPFSTERLLAAASELLVPAQRVAA
jgi:PAS domain S-box-containing protein